MTTDAELQTDDAKKVLDLLVALEYVASEGERYRARVPVLAARDRAMVDALRRIGQEVMEKWFAENYERLRADLANVTPWKHGQPFAEGFYPIWHYLFGAANRKLVEAGLFADPYEHTRLYKGYIPAVSDASLYKPLGPPSVGASVKTAK